MSPIEFLIRRRIHHAQELLANSSFSIRQIAEMCGFSSSQYFARLFARRTGKAPTQFRHDIAPEAFPPVSTLLARK